MPKHTLATTAVAIIALLVGAAAGSAATAAETATPAPAPTVTATATVTKPVTPAACIDALSKADRLITDTAHGISIMEGMITQDATSLLTATSELNSFNPTIQSDRSAFNGAETACRNAG